MFVAEVQDKSTGIRSLTVYTTNGDMQAACMTATGELKGFPTMKSSNCKARFTDMLALYLPIVASCTAKDRLMVGIKSTFESFAKDSNNMRLLAELNDLIVENLKSQAIPLHSFAAGNAQILHYSKIKMGIYSGGEVFCGTSHVFNTTGGNNKTTTKFTVQDAQTEFADYLSTLSWTAEEEMLIPQFPEDFPVPETTLKIARRFLATRNNKRPMTQFMWRGPTSIGKSTGIECLAAILHTPLLRVTCHPTMETQDFLADFVPDTSSVPANLPSFDDIEFDPVQSYQVLTGVYNEKATCQMCLEAYGKAASAQSNTPRFKFVESNYVKALTRGYICEVQESSRIRNEGTLVGLNEYDRPGSVIPLMDGSYKTRHPNAIVVFSDNKGYASCRSIDPSVLRRMAMIIDSDELPKKTLFERVKYNTGCSDSAMLEKMYKVYRKIIEYCESNDLMDKASVSATEFEMWVSCTMLDGFELASETVRECVVNKAVSDTERQQEIMKNIVEVNLL